MQTNGPANDEKDAVHCCHSTTSCVVVSGCMAALEAKHFRQEHCIQQDKAEPTAAENEVRPDNGHARLDMQQFDVK